MDRREPQKSLDERSHNNNQYLNNSNQYWNNSDQYWNNSKQYWNNNEQYWNNDRMRQQMNDFTFQANLFGVRIEQYHHARANEMHQQMHSLVSHIETRNEMFLMKCLVGGLGVIAGVSIMFAFARSK
jgi:hypothetical protein